MSSGANEPMPFYNALLLLRRTLFPFCHDPYPWVKGIRNIFEINQKLFCKFENNFETK
jgi:hypothetical protein